MRCIGGRKKTVAAGDGMIRGGSMSARDVTARRPVAVFAVER
jgi:hypothetical protein